jgi:hypothetical protein
MTGRHPLNNRRSLPPTIGLFALAPGIGQKDDGIGVLEDQPARRFVVDFAVKRIPVDTKPFAIASPRDSRTAERAVLS